MTLWLRVLGPVFGVAGFFAAFLLIPGLWGYAVGFAVFFGCSAICDWIWRRNASHEEIRRDLEDRARNTSP